jgi:DNA-binding transcriptional MerR regulator
VTSPMPGRSRLSIGQVLGELRPDFPDVTISKIRFLESEGLVEPERTSSGYRKFSRADVARLRYVLTAQRERYWPLKVIKEHLNAIDEGREPEVAADELRMPVVVLSTDGQPSADTFKRDTTDVRFTRRQLIEAAGIDEALLTQIERFGLLSTHSGARYYDADALLVAKTVGEMAAFGVEPRHLRAFKAAADREVGLFEQVVTPLLRQRDGAAKARAEEVVQQLATASVRLHAMLVKIGLRSAR